MSFSPGIITRPAQTGQPVPSKVRDWTETRHVCPFSQRHQTLRLVPKVTSRGVSEPLGAGCPAPAQNGQPRGPDGNPGTTKPVFADRTAAAAYAGADLRLPFMALRTLPPDLFFTPRQNLFRRQGQIPGGVPFFDQILILAGQIRFPRPGEPPRAVGAVRVVGGTGIDCRLPDMSLGAYPPDLPRTAIGDLLWRQRPILGRVPLSQQSRLTSLHAVVV